MWLHRSNRNLRSLGNRHLEFTPFSAVGWWFVPIANLVCPYQAVAEIWRGSDPRNVAKNYAGGKTSAFVKWWWARFLVMDLMGFASLFIISPASSSFQAKMDTLITVNWLLFTRSLIALPAAVLAILVVRGVDVNQQAALRIGPGGSRPSTDAADARCGARRLPVHAPGQPRALAVGRRRRAIPAVQLRTRLDRESRFFAGMFRLTEPLYFHIVKQVACTASRHRHASLRGGP